MLEGTNIFTDKNWFWIGAAGLLGFTSFFNVLFTLCLTYLNRKYWKINLIAFRVLIINFGSVCNPLTLYSLALGKPQAVISEETAKEAEDNVLLREMVSSAINLDN